MVTDKQKSAVHFCEDVLKINFEGNIENYANVSKYLSKNLYDAKMQWKIIEHECLGLGYDDIY